MWKEVVVVYCKVISQLLPGGIEVKDEKPQPGYPVSRLIFELAASQNVSKKRYYLSRVPGYVEFVLNKTGTQFRDVVWTWLHPLGDC
jgi:hypothetical protein